MTAQIARCVFTTTPLRHQRKAEEEPAMSPRPPDLTSLIDRRKRRLCANIFRSALQFAHIIIAVPDGAHNLNSLSDSSAAMLSTEPPCCPFNPKMSHKFIFDTSPYQYPTTSTLLASDSEWISLPCTDPASGSSRVTLISSVHKTFENEVNLLPIEDDDGANSKAAEQTARSIDSCGPALRQCSSQLRSRTVHVTGDSYRTYEKRGKPLSLRPSKGNATGMNMLGASKKLGENAQNIPHCPGTMLQGRLFHHISITQTGLKTAAQRKEYPPHVQKVDIDAVRVSERLEDMQCTEEDSEMEPEPVIRRKVQQIRKSSFHTFLSTRESTGQVEPAQHCTCCVKENKSKTRCQSCRDAQRLCGQSTSSSESPASLARPSIHR
ncbi:unnamed protein product, partial [Ranitomeya imitator]